MTWDRDALRAEVSRQLDGLDGLEVDLQLLEEHAQALAEGRLGPEQNCFEGDPEPAGPDQVDSAAAFSEHERERYRALGREALAQGRVAVAVLNGGMATRFGGVVKGAVEAVAGRSFLEIKLAQASAAGPVPLLVMNSFATQRASAEFLRERGLDARVEAFLQSVSLRLTRGGDLFRDASGALSLYAPGHGDFPAALRASGKLAQLERRGVSFLLLSNVDNLGAEPDPLVIGYHIAHGRPLTCEVAEVAAGDVGGTPALAGGRLQIVEGFRFSEGFDFSRLHFLATNTFVFSLETLRQPHPLRWFYVERRVDGRPAVQMERLVNELSALVDSAYLATQRDGPQGRFFPIKSPEDLERLRADPLLVERFASV